MADVSLTLEQRRAIHGADEWLGQAGLPTYTELLGALEKHTRPQRMLPVGATIQLAAPTLPAPSLDEVLSMSLPPAFIADGDTEGGAE